MRDPTPRAFPLTLEKVELAIAPTVLVGDGKTLMGSSMGSSFGWRDVQRLMGLWPAVRQIVKPHMKSAEIALKCRVGMRDRD